MTYDPTDPTCQSCGGNLDAEGHRPGCGNAERRPFSFADPSSLGGIDLLPFSDIAAKTHRRIREMADEAAHRNRGRDFGDEDRIVRRAYSIRAMAVIREVDHVLRDQEAGIPVEKRLRRLGEVTAELFGVMGADDELVGVSFERIGRR